MNQQTPSKPAAPTLAIFPGLGSKVVKCIVNLNGDRPARIESGASLLKPADPEKGRHE